MTQNTEQALSSARAAWRAVKAQLDDPGTPDYIVTKLNRRRRYLVQQIDDLELELAIQQQEQARRPTPAIR